MMVLQDVGGGKMARRKSAYIFAPEKQRGGGLGLCYDGAGAAGGAGRSGAFVQLCGQQPRGAGNGESARKGLDKAFEGFTVLL